MPKISALTTATIPIGTEVIPTVQSGSTLGLTVSQIRGAVGQSAVQVSHTGDTSEFVLATVTIPANTLGKNGRIEIWANFGNNNSGNNKTYRIRWGASGAGTGGTQIWTGSNTTNVTHAVPAGVANRNATNSQVVIGGQAANGWSGSTTLVTAAIDTTAATEVTFTGQLANSGDNVTIEAYSVRVIPGA